MCSSDGAVYINVTPKATIDEGIVMTSLLNVACSSRNAVNSYSIFGYYKQDVSKMWKFWRKKKYISLKVVTLIS